MTVAGSLIAAIAVRAESVEPVSCTALKRSMTNATGASFAPSLLSSVSSATLTGTASPMVMSNARSSCTPTGEEFHAHIRKILADDFHLIEILAADDDAGCLAASAAPFASSLSHFRLQPRRLFLLLHLLFLRKWLRGDWIFPGRLGQSRLQLRRSVRAANCLPSGRSARSRVSHRLRFGYTFSSASFAASHDFTTRSSPTENSAFFPSFAYARRHTGFSRANAVLTSFPPSTPAVQMRNALAPHRPPR